MKAEEELYLDEIVVLGEDAARGNLLGIEPYLSNADYSSAAELHLRLHSYFRRAQHLGWIGDRTVVVLPEYLGTWLVAAEMGPAVCRARTLQDAMLRLALRRLPRFVRAYLLSQEKERSVAALFRMRAPAMAQHYQDVYSELAREHRVTIVAGSVVLPEPSIQRGLIVPGPGALQNVTAVFGPGGDVHPALARKVYPIGEELGFTRPAAVEELPAFDTPAGRLVVLICADAWYPAAYARARELGAELLAVPSCIAHSGLWTMPWRGYDGAAAPPDVDARDVGALTEGEAWRKYALAGRIHGSGARAGINVFLRGALWDLGADTGCGTLVREGNVAQGKGGRAALLNLWL